MPRQHPCDSAPPLLPGSHRRCGGVGTISIKPVSTAVVRAAFVAQVAASYPAAAPLRRQFWSLLRHPPCGCRWGFERVEGHRRGRRPPSSETLAPFFDTGIARWVPDDELGAPHSCGSAFILPTGRLILHPARLNDDPISNPPDFRLPSPRLVAEVLDGATWVYKADAKSFFYQIPLPPAAWAAFRFWLTTGADGIRAAELTRRRRERTG